MAVTAVGKDMQDAQYQTRKHLCRARRSYRKTYYVEDGFETITSTCPVPIKKWQAARNWSNSMPDNGTRRSRKAHRVDMEEIFSRGGPSYDAGYRQGRSRDMKPKDAFDLFHTLKQKMKKQRWRKHKMAVEHLKNLRRCCLGSTGVSADLLNSGALKDGCLRLQSCCTSI
jgi:putative autoinducer-2 (AI-2) aldolase